MMSSLSRFRPLVEVALAGGLSKPFAPIRVLPHESVEDPNAFVPVAWKAMGDLYRTRKAVEEGHGASTVMPLPFGIQPEVISDWERKAQLTQLIEMHERRLDAVLDWWESEKEGARIAQEGTLGV